MTRLAKIEALIATTTDKQLLRLLNRAYWREFFRIINMDSQRFTDAA